MTDEEARVWTVIRLLEICEQLIEAFESVGDLGAVCVTEAVGEQVREAAAVDGVD